MKISIGATHSTNDSFSIAKEQLQARIFFSNVLFFRRARVVATRYHIYKYDTSLVSGMYIFKEVCYLTTSIAAIHFFYGSVIISREHLKRSKCQGHCVYFTTFVTIICYNKRYVVSLRKFEGYIYLKKTILVLIFRENLKGTFNWKKPF